MTFCMTKWFQRRPHLKRKKTIKKDKKITVYGRLFFISHVICLGGTSTG